MKIRKKNFILVLILFLFFILSFAYYQLEPIFKIQATHYFHEKVITEIMNSVALLEVPQDFIERRDEHMSINTNQLNQWLISVNETLNESMEEVYHASIPMGYFSGIVFFQSMGPNVSASFMISSRILARYDIKTTNLGINNALIELILNVECIGNVLLGFSSAELIVSEKIPLALEYVQGEVPQVFPYSNK